MTKIDIFSGFLGAGKTTLIKKLIQEAYAGEKVVLIENEFGEIGIDGGFLKEAGVNITEMNSGCICCSLVGDFSKALEEVEKQFSPNRIIIEPSGVGKLSDVVKAAKKAHLHDATLNACCTVVDAGKCKMYLKNFGEFFGDQVEHADCIILSHTDNIAEDKLATAVALLREKNLGAAIVTAPWKMLDGKTILAAMERKNQLHDELKQLQEETHHHHHDEHCCCHEHEHEHGHGCHEHHHEHHDHDEHCCCHEHHHEHHHADEVFTSWGVETTKTFTKSALTQALASIQKEEIYGTVLRAKGIVAGEEKWLHFDYVPGEADVREGGAFVTGRICVIGCQLNEKALAQLFGV